ncbi:MAG: hypothetical protein M1457_08580, partial [bacterium]|nr:hypothetical protein [bacterium]
MEPIEPASSTSSPPAVLAVLARGLSERAGGVREYIAELTRALAADPPAGWGVRAYLSSPAQRRLLPGVETAVLPGRNRLRWDHWLAPRRLRADRPSVVLCPKGVVPLGLGRPALVTLHDLLYFRLPARPGAP